MLIPIVIAATLAVALLSGCDEPAAPAAASRPVRAVTVEPVDIGQALSQTGEIQPRYETDLGFRIGGQILARPVDVASVIGRGDLLARLDDQRARSQMQSAQAGLAAAAAELTRAQAEEARQSALLKDGFSTEVVRSSDDDSTAAKLAARATASPLDVLRTFPSLAPLLEPIGAQLLSKIEPLLEWFGMPAGTVLFQEGKAAREAYILVSGRLGVFVAAETELIPVAQISPGEIVGEMSLISGEPRSATVLALRDSEAVRLPCDTVTSAATGGCASSPSIAPPALLMDAHPQFSFFVMRLPRRPRFPGLGASLHPAVGPGDLCRRCTGGPSWGQRMGDRLCRRTPSSRRSGPDQRCAKRAADGWHGLAAALPERADHSRQKRR